MTIRLVQLEPITPTQLTYRLPPAFVLAIFDGDVMLDGECYSRFEPFGDAYFCFIKLKHPPACEVRALVSDRVPESPPANDNRVLHDILEELRLQNRMIRRSFSAAASVGPKGTA